MINVKSMFQGLCRRAFLIFAVFMGLILLGLMTSCQKDNTEPPKPLVKFQPLVSEKLIFKREPTSGSGRAFLTLGPVVADGKVFSVGKTGGVASIDAKTGHRIWYKNLRADLSSTPAVFDGKVFVGSLDGELFCLDESSGNIIWEVSLPSSLLAPPVGDDSHVFVHTHDDSLTVFDLQTGKQIWQVLGNTPSLTMAGDAAPVLFNNLVILANHSGELLAYQVNNGQLAWERPVALPSGGTDVAQMVDIIGTPVLDNGVLYVATYHGNLAEVSPIDGSLIWQHPVSSLRDLAVADLSNSTGVVVVTNEKGHVLAFDKHTGRALWSQDAFEARFTTGPGVVLNNNQTEGFVVVGDYAGYLHVLNLKNGEQVGQVKLSSHAIKAPVFVSNDLFYATDADGHVAAYEINKK